MVDAQIEFAAKLQYKDLYRVQLRLPVFIGYCYSIIIIRALRVYELTLPSIRSKATIIAIETRLG